MEQIEEIQNNEEELAVSVKDQQLASLCGIGRGLLSVGDCPSKKWVKKSCKAIKANLVSSLGHEGANEIISHNQAVIEMTLHGAKYGQKNGHTKNGLKLIREDLFETFKRGMENI